MQTNKQFGHYFHFISEQSPTISSGAFVSQHEAWGN